MSQARTTNTLLSDKYPNGSVTLHRIHLNTENPEVACGKLSLWNQIVREISTGSYEYYSPGDGTNKFLKHITIECYSKAVPYPDANIGGQVTYALGNGNSKITCPFSDPNQYWFKAAMSHEFGHAYHNWIRMLEGGVYTDVKRWWDHEITIDKVSFDPNKYPWRQPDGSLQRSEEQFANSFRILFGTVGTRGNLELVPQGMCVTTLVQDLPKKFQRLPELCAMISNYGGIKPGTLKWVNGGFMFQIPSGHWIWQQDYNIWQSNVQNVFGQWSGWKQFFPTYTRD
jgi:hypothetical protein